MSAGNGRGGVRGEVREEVEKEKWVMVGERKSNYFTHIKVKLLLFVEPMVTYFPTFLHCNMQQI